MTPTSRPSPHKDLLAFDPTPILKDISETDNEIFIGEKMNYAIKGTLNTVRLDDELIRFDHFDAERGCLARNGIQGQGSSRRLSRI